MQESSNIDRLIGLIREMTAHEHDIMLNRLEGNHYKEKRVKPRKANPVPLDYTVRNRVFQGFIHDISVGGVFIGTGESIPVGQEILALIPLPNSPKSIRVRGDVVRNTPNGIGVKFKRQPKA